MRFFIDMSTLLLRILIIGTRSVILTFILWLRTLLISCVLVWSWFGVFRGLWLGVLNPKLGPKP